MRKIICLITFFIYSFSFSQEGAGSCAQLQANPELYQSCATSIPFTNSTQNNSGEAFQTTCIPTNFAGPTWFFILINQTGPIVLQISQVSTAGAAADVDFVLWGPFSSLTGICPQLTIANEVDCSYSASAIETVSFPNAVAGEYYILVVDNFANVPGEISIAQTGGTGSSDCSFLSSVKISDINNQEITDLNYCNPH